MIKLAVFGDPIAHSLSPTIHTRFAQHAGIDIDYQAIHADADTLIDALTDFREHGGVGANLTVPHKQTGLSVCESTNRRAQAAGAVNTLIRTDTGWHGDNTDGLGLIWDLHRLQLNLEDNHILIIGAGGAACGILPALLEQNPANIIIANRTLSRAQRVAERFNQYPVSACELEDVEGLKSIELVIHASAAGHSDNTLDLPALAYASNPFCYDLSYGTAAQLFINWARQHQYSCADGLGMLVGQAAEAFTLWTGCTLSDDIRTQVLKDLKNGHT